ncbi:biotin/lipoyl-binding protein [Thiolapillus sp.]|uniref:biotin/lipoyl-binding protein n=1 Tax=Thiolapillus sp. TaxID=2017437 RepID=UPI0025DA4722|nr:biotin/lipoyl-binding protein [Thiolapillus sp.]
MKKLIPLVLVLLIGGGIFAWYKYQPQTSDSSKLALYGNIDIREAQLTFNASEHVDSILVEEGEHVTRGQLLAVLHQELLKSQVAQAQVEAKQQLLAKLQAGSRKEEIDKAKAELEAAQARAKSAHDTWQRLQRLTSVSSAS